MPLLSRTLIATWSLLAASLTFAREEIISTSDHRRIVLQLPEGFAFSSREDQGVVSAQITNTDRSVSLEIEFASDPGSRLGSAEKQKTFLAEAALSDAEQSVEKSYDFRSLEPRVGSGTYCVFTDAALQGKTPPPGEFHKLTRGVKAWSGFAMIFTLVSQDETSDAYRAAMKIVRETSEEKSPVVRGPSI